METIKIGRKTYDIKKCDYIVDNGACFQFVAGDRRTLKYSDWTSYYNLVIPESVMKNIDLSKLRKVEKTTQFGHKLTYYYFN